MSEAVAKLNAIGTKASSNFVTIFPYPEVHASVRLAIQISIEDPDRHR